MPQRCDKTLTNYTLEIFKGASCGRSFRYYNPNNETPIDLTGKIVSIGIKDVFDSTLKLSSNESPNAYGSFIEITDAANGEFRFLITDEQTATAGTGMGRWWMELDDAGDIKLLWRDNVSVSEI